MDSRASPTARQTPSCAAKDNTSGRMNLSTTGYELLPNLTAFRPTSNAIQCRPSSFPDPKNGRGLARLRLPPSSLLRPLLVAVNLCLPCATLSAPLGEPCMPTRQAAWKLLCEYTASESLRKHMLAVEACVRAYARKSGADEEVWGLTALLHDFDYERWPNHEHSPDQGHPSEGAKILR